jgi:hypothetical protein
MKVSSSSVIVLAGALVATAFTIAEPLPRPANDNAPSPQHGEHEEPSRFSPSPARRRPVVVHQD